MYFLFTPPAQIQWADPWMPQDIRRDENRWADAVMTLAEWKPSEGLVEGAGPQIALRRGTLTNKGILVSFDDLGDLVQLRQLSETEARFSGAAANAPGLPTDFADNATDFSKKKIAALTESVEKQLAESPKRELVEYWQQGGGHAE